MPTQEEFIQALISRLQPPGTPRPATQFDRPITVPPVQFAAKPIEYGQPQHGSFASGFSVPQPLAQPARPSYGQSSFGRTIYKDNKGNFYS